MSRKARRHRRRNGFAQAMPAPIAAPVAKKLDPLAVRLASTDLDAAAIHAFLCNVAPQLGVLQCPINAEKSMLEVWRIVRALDHAGPGEVPYGFALMAQIGDRLVGTLGAVCPEWWYGDARFFSDRWLFSLPGIPGVGAALTSDADALATEAGLPFILNLKQRKRPGSSIVHARARKVA